MNKYEHRFALQKKISENLIYTVEVINRGYRNEIREFVSFKGELECTDVHTETNTRTNIITSYNKLGYTLV